MCDRRIEWEKYPDAGFAICLLMMGLILKLALIGFDPIGDLPNVINAETQVCHYKPEGGLVCK